MEVRVRNRWFILILWSIIFVITSTLVFKLSYRNYRKPIQQDINPSKPMVAITFDDGPNSTYTPQVLDILYENNAFGTFFICGQYIEGNERILKEMIQCGHEIENHTYSHQRLTSLTQDEIANEISLSQKSIQKVLPDYEFLYVRPPYGDYNETVENEVELPLALWDIDSGDWIQTDEQVICNNVIDNVKDGSIIVFHDDSECTVNALEKIIPELEEQGFQLVTISQLYQYKQVTSIEEK